MSRMAGRPAMDALQAEQINPTITPQLTDVIEIIRGIQRSKTTFGVISQGLHVTVPISTAQIRTLYSLPVEIIPAPGAGLIAIYEKYVARSSLATQDFSSGISLLLRWKNAPNNDALSLNAVFGIGASPFVGAGSAWSDAFSGGVPLYDASDPSNSTVNSAIELASFGDVTDGDSTLLLTVWYSIISAT